MLSEKQPDLKDYIHTDSFYMKYPEERNPEENSSRQGLE